MCRQMYRAKRSLFLLVVSCALILALAGCGTNAGAGSPASAATSTATPSQTITASASPTGVGAQTSPTATVSTAQGQSANDGCPGNRVITAPLPAAAVVLKQARNRATVSVQKGETVEVDLSFGLTWHGPLQSTQNLLEMQVPGYAYPAARVCVWRFTALRSGTANLSFTGTPICRTVHACPMYVVAVQFTVEIK